MRRPLMNALLTVTDPFKLDVLVYIVTLLSLALGIAATRGTIVKDG